MPVAKCSDIKKIVCEFSRGRITHFPQYNKSHISYYHTDFYISSICHNETIQ